VAKTQFIPALKFKILTPSYDFFIKYFFPENKFKNQLLHSAEIKPEDKILDFGCGTGTLLILAKTKFPKIKVTGIDIDEKILEIAGKKIKRKKLDIELKKYDGDKLPLKINSFDKVISSLVFHHLNREQKINALKEIYRILKKDGLVVIGDFGKPQNKFVWLIAKILSWIEPTGDNIRGMIPEYMKKVGFTSVKGGKYINTFFGSVTVYTGRK